MSEFSFQDATEEAWDNPNRDDVEAILRRAYAAGQASGGGSDLDRLVKLAQADPDWRRDDRPFLAEHAANIAENCVIMLSALKAQAVKP